MGGSDLQATGRPLLVDGLNSSRRSVETLEALQRAGVSCVHLTAASMWAGLEQSLRELLELKALLREHPTVARLVTSAAEIEAAHCDGVVGVLTGWQNTGGFADYLPYVEAFHDLGLRVVQLTYNTANAVGSGCYESTDGGLTDFGRDLVRELNRLGMLVDLSHVGVRTAVEAVDASLRPVAFTHTLPAALNPHPRNRHDDELRHVAARGGFVGATCYAPFLRPGGDATLDDFLAAIEHLLSVVGEQAVGIATDFTDGQPDDFWRYLGRDKGYGRQVVTWRPEGKPLVNPRGLDRGNEDLGALRPAMLRRGWGEQLADDVLGRNWLRFLAAALVTAPR